MQTRLLIIVACIALITCKKNEDPAPKTTLLTFSQDATGLQTSLSDDWIFITDEAGVILDNQAFEVGNTITLASSKTLPSQKINVTIFRKENGGFTSLKSYLGIPVGQTWKYLIPAVTTNPGPSPGKFTLTINNYPGGPPNPIITFSDPSGIILGGTGSPTPSGAFKVQVPLNVAPVRVYVTSIRNNQPVYLNLGMVSPGADLTADFNTDFKVNDHLVNYSYSETNPVLAINAFIQGLDPGSSEIFPGGNHLCDYYVNNPGNPFPLGYNDGFTSYKTDFYFYETKSIKRYSKVGPVPSVVPLLNYTLTIANNTVGNFNFTISGTYNLRHSNWRDGTSNTQWDVYASSEGQQLLPNIPDEIKTKYPTLNATQLSYFFSEFTVYLDGFSYEKFLSRGITGPWTKGSAEYQVIQF